MRDRKKIVLKSLVIIAFLVFLVANSNTITSPIRTKLLDLSVIPLKALHSFYAAAGRLLPFASLTAENKRLREKIDLLVRQGEESKYLLIENRRLKGILDFQDAIPFATIPAEVIGRDPTNWSNSLIIDKGSANQVSQGNAVISMKGLIGRALEVGRYSSKILLITDTNSKVGVVIQRNRQGGILVGRPDGRCKIIYIALDSDVMKGDKVITAGFGSVFPKGILVGDVVSVYKEPGRLYKCAIVRPAQDMTKLEEVMCIK
ncbi:MAG: rod shape-determining protein MreC [Candidatus Omnitrophica bacterium]|nr:rod shape-determining protein MreC [Candidatus Omnitrophota bacterium]MBU0880930.1 rod shape-determining protein MreC [Candidatus Omnitrophota bacterium]MBU0895799.1 rod shape-determining protein MreC [Candidatus Omnitrophota bacterium]MBU1808342.1 rod shape-determining protein MreC [Candidatus Omnitrophota bacterium]